MTPSSSKRKKWTEEEERTLIDNYAEMVADGSLPKMKTREKKFRPIAAHVNAVHHCRDPVAFPWQWSWKDASTKVQNMRHQYLLVKQKIHNSTKDEPPSISSSTLDFDWDEGLTHWPNFLRYKDVFGDVPLVGPKNESATGDGDGSGGGDGGGEVGENGFECEGAGGDSGGRRKRRKAMRGVERRICGLVTAQLARLEAAEEGREEERRRRREEEAAKMREWEERMERRRVEWKKQMEEMLAQHRATMEQLQARIVHDQNAIINQLLGILSQWAGPSAAIADHVVGAAHPDWLSQAMQSLHHVNEIVHAGDGMVDGEDRVDAGDHEDQFIVDE